MDGLFAPASSARKNVQRKSGRIGGQVKLKMHHRAFDAHKAGVDEAEMETHVGRSKLEKIDRPETEPQGTPTAR